jgi:hypothetical protein
VSVAFFLNFDAELELEGGPRYTPTRAIEERTRQLATAMRPTLPTDAVIVHPLGEVASTEAIAITWSPTPRALRFVDAAGLTRPTFAPSIDVLRRVNDRRFAFALADELAGACSVANADEAREALARPGEWLLKRCFGVSGRGQRRVRGGDTSALDLAFVEASLRKHGALVIEPRVPIERELSVHAWQVDGRTKVRSFREPIVDSRGQFVRSRNAAGLTPSIRDSLEATAIRVGAALHAAGYDGPFGIDAFVYRVNGRLELRALSEINARFCMGWDEADGWLAPG